MLSDETDLVQVFGGSETEFDGPVKERFYPFSKYYEKRMNPEFSASVTLSADLLTINRKTDSFLDWMGDWGGLIDGLTLIAEILINNYQVYSLKLKVAWLFVRFKPSKYLKFDDITKKDAYNE